MAKATWWAVAGFFIPLALGTSMVVAFMICLATAALSAIGG